MIFDITELVDTIFSHSQLVPQHTILFNSATVFLKYFLRVRLFVDILCIFVNGTSRAIFSALFEINNLIRDPSRTESVAHFVCRCPDAHATTQPPGGGRAEQGLCNGLTGKL